MPRLVYWLVMVTLWSCVLCLSAHAQSQAMRTGVYRIEVYSDGVRSAGTSNQRAEAAIARRLRRMGEQVVDYSPAVALAHPSCKDSLSAECLGELAGELQVRQVMGGEIRWHGNDAQVSLWLFDRNSGQRHIEEMRCEQCTSDQVNAAVAALAGTLVDNGTIRPGRISNAVSVAPFVLTYADRTLGPTAAPRAPFSRARKVGASIFGSAMLASLGAAIALTALNGTSVGCVGGDQTGDGCTRGVLATIPLAAVLYSISGITATGLTLSLTIPPADRGR